MRSVRIGVLSLFLLATLATPVLAGGWPPSYRTWGHGGHSYGHQYGHSWKGHSHHGRYPGSYGAPWGRSYGYDYGRSYGYYGQRPYGYGHYGYSQPGSSYFYYRSGPRSRCDR